MIARDGIVIARGRTGRGGRPHAETEALRMAGEAASGATAYVTLEPCSHQGQTPPCADALIAAGIARVVIAAGDPDPRVNGRGLARLREAGVQVETGVLAAEAQDTLAGFVSRITQGRPLITLKLASTLDGRIATAGGQSQWITGPAARRAVHALRGRHDAVMVGIGTLLADDPDLTCRLPGYVSRPTVRIIADSTLRTPPTAHVVHTAYSSPTWVLHRQATERGRAQLLAEAGVRCIEVAAGEGGLDLPACFQALGTRGLTRVLVEGGAALAAALLRADLVDRIAWFHAPALIGGDGMAAIHHLGLKDLSQMPRFTTISITRLGDDMLTELTRAA